MTEEILHDEKPEDKIATKKDIQDVIGSIKELTEAIKKLTEENKRWFRAGKM